MVDILIMGDMGVDIHIMAAILIMVVMGDMAMATGQYLLFNSIEFNTD
jgi:hypothetical protein